MQTALIIAVIVQWVAIVGLAALLLAVLRQIGVIHQRLAPMGALALPGGPAVGTVAPGFELPSLSGSLVKVGGRSARDTLLFFLSPTCPVCKELLPALKSFARDEGRQLDVVLASDGDAAEQRRMVRDNGLEAMPLVLSTELGQAYAVGKLPYAVIITADGKLAAKGLVNSREHLESLVEARSRGVATLQDYLAGTRAAAE
ncbi:methylamine dehydrogenase accessory protein MauD [Parapedomonas caeni]